jgi:transcriptional regulator with XRE-family HTH domain
MTLQDWMDKRGLNDRKFANKYPVVSRSQVSRIRRGESCPSPETARKLEEITKIPAAKFVLGEAGAPAE